jgi:hypothetical protein
MDSITAMLCSLFAVFGNSEPEKKHSSRGSASFFGLEKLAMGLGLFVIVTAVLLLVIVNLGAQLPANSSAQNATNGSVTYFTTLLAWAPLLVLIVIAGIMIAAVVGFMRTRG